MLEEIKNSRPIQIALAAVVLIGGYLLLAGGGDEVVPPSPPAVAPVPGPGTTGETGPTGETRTPAEIRRQQRADERRAAKAAGLPVEVYRAKKRGQIVMIFFWEPRGKDDQAVDDAVREVNRERPRTVVFRDRIRNTSRYDGIAEFAKVNQTPSIVILFRSRAVAIEGFIDSGTLKQKINEVVHAF